ncbi:MAG: hypothetical protein K0Q81_994, partial [Paenibacillus sp.]|nr:hypothetical protein [Paenibacillus sp.]
VEQIQREIGMTLERREMDRGSNEREPRERQGEASAKSSSGRSSGRSSRDSARTRGAGARGSERGTSRGAGARSGELGSSRGAGARGSERGSSRDSVRGAGRSARSDGRNAERSSETKPVSGYGLSRGNEQRSTRSESSFRGTVLASARLSKDNGAGQAVTRVNEPKADRSSEKPVSGYALAAKNNKRSGRGDIGSRGAGPTTAKPVSGFAQSRDSESRGGRAGNSSRGAARGVLTAGGNDRSRDSDEWSNNKRNSGKQGRGAAVSSKRSSQPSGVSSRGRTNQSTRRGK